MGGAVRGAEQMFICPGLQKTLATPLYIIREISYGNGAFNGYLTIDNQNNILYRDIVIFCFSCCFVAHKLDTLAKNNGFT